MNFLYPQFLWALLAIAIPIIIHLFNFRRFKKIYFSDLQLLKEVELKTSKKSNLKHLLILLSRILAIAGLVFAFAQPYFPSNEIQDSFGEKLVSVYVDNSFSMNNKVEEFSLLDNAKKEAENIANLYKQSDKFQLITNDFDPRHQRFITKKEFVDFLQDIELSAKTKELSQIEQKQLDFLKRENSDNRIGYYISDFQQSSANLDKLKLDSTVQLNLVSIEPKTNGNVYIDSVWLSSPVRVLDIKENLTIRIVNTTPDDIQLKAELTINGIVQGIVNKDVLSNSSEEVLINYVVKKPGIVEAMVKISEYPDPVNTFDDTYYFSYLLKESSNVLAINNSSLFQDGKRGNINQLFKNDAYFKITNVSASSIDYSKFPESNMIILNQLNAYSSGLTSELMKYVEAGGTVLLIPGEKPDFNSINEFLLSSGSGRFVSKEVVNTKVTELNYQHPFFKDVFEKRPKNIDLPKVFNYYKLSSSSRSRKVNLMKLQTGDDFLSKFSYKKGNIFLFTVPLNDEFSNLPRHSLFVASLLRMAETSGEDQPLSLDMGEERLLIKDKNYSISEVHITNKNKSVDFIPEVEKNGGDIELYLSQDIKKAENFRINSKEKLIGSFGLNYSRLESNFDSYSIKELEDKLASKFVKIFSVTESEDSSFSQNNLKDKTKLWKIFLWLVLLFLLLEIVLIKVMK